MSKVVNETVSDSNMASDSSNCFSNTKVNTLNIVNPDKKNNSLSKNTLNNAINGVLIINKDKGFTSFDVVAIVRKLTGQKKIGHCGTLDPNATGVLPLLLGNATKAQDILPNHQKEYSASFLLGKETDTLDIWGETVAQQKSCVTKAELVKALERFRGDIVQVPPMYSAVKKDGQRLYDLARQGIKVERESRKVTVYKLELLSFDENEQSGKFFVSCSKGTYIRSIIDDLGKVLGCGAVMTSLCRTNACGYPIEQAIMLDKLKKTYSEKSFLDVILPTQSLFESYGHIYVSDLQARRFSNGGALDINRTCLRDGCKDKEIYRVKDNSGRFLGLGITDVQSGMLKIYKLF